MKTLKISLLALSLGLMSFSTISKNEKKSSEWVTSASLLWKSDVIELGEIPQSVPKIIEFEFENKGAVAVVITNAQASCGCTVADYSKEPIAPGKTGKIKATYNAAAAGPFTKTITVTTSDDATPKILTFKGKVIPKV